MESLVTTVTGSKVQKYIAFSISAGCYFYQLGIAYYLQQNFNLEYIKFSGASGGSWPAVLLAAKEDIKKAFEYVITYGTQCAKNRPILGAYMVYDQGVDIVFKKLWGNVHLPSLVNGKLALSVTRLAWETSIPYLKDEIVTEFYSNQDIYECVIASALIPFALNGKPYVIYRGWICADGGITNVTGVRHFAEELVHDIELIEEEIVEQAHHFTDEIVHTLQDELLSQDSESLENHGKKASPTQRHLPFTTGPKDIVQFGVTVSLTIIDVITDSLERLLESRKRSVLHQSTNTPTEHLLYQPSPLVLNSMEANGSRLLHGVLSDVHPSCQQIIDRLHDASNRLHSQNHLSLSNEKEKPQRVVSSKSSSSLFSVCDSICSTILGKKPFFDDASLTIQEIFAQETHWLGNHPSSFSSQPLLENVINQYDTSINTSITPSGALTSEHDDISQQLSDAPVCLSQVNSFQHLECKDYREEDDDEEQRIHSVSTNYDGEMIEISSSPPQPPVGRSSLVKIFPSPSDSVSSYNDMSSDSYKTPLSISSKYQSMGKSPPGVGSVDYDRSVGNSTVEADSIHSKNSDHYWKKQGDIIKQIPNGGGIQLEISPWMWRHHSIWNYHLSADPIDAIKLFNMGINDAYDHHHELKQFFDIE